MPAFACKSDKVTVEPPVIGREKSIAGLPTETDMEKTGICARRDAGAAIRRVGRSVVVERDGSGVTEKVRVGDRMKAMVGEGIRVESSVCLCGRGSNICFVVGAVKGKGWQSEMLIISAVREAN